jgi:putative nucleotidyltransferase with HDIG domain
VRQNLLALLSTHETALDAVVRELSEDPALVAQILRIVNSAYYGLSNKLADVRRAVALLGYGTVRNILLLEQCLSSLTRNRKDKSDFDWDGYLDHSLWVANAAYLMSSQTDCGWPDEYFTAGLLHDLGRAAAAQFFTAKFNHVLHAEKEGERIVEAEERILGADHARIGAYLCWTWNFPDFVTQAVAYHVRPLERLAATPMCREALLACAACRMSGMEREDELSSWCNLAGITMERFREIRVRAPEMVQYAHEEIFAVA